MFEAFGRLLAAEVQTPTEGRRSGMGVRVCAVESRPATGAVLTGSLTARLDENGRRSRSARAAAAAQTPASGANPPGALAGSHPPVPSPRRRGIGGGPATTRAAGATARGRGRRRH